MSDETERQIRVDAWDAGTPLDWAWFTFGNERQRRQQIERRGTGASLSIQALMVADLFGRLFEREFVAWGYLVEPTISDGPVVVPHDMFSEPPADRFGSNTISVSGYTYERVRISPAAEFNAGAAPAANAIDQSRADKPGPKDTYSTAKLIIAELFEEEPARRPLSAAKLLDMFNLRYVACGKAIGVEVAGLSERTLREHLKRYRSE